MSIPSGHVFRVERGGGPVWYAKYRLAGGRQVQKKIGPAWTERGRPANGYFTKRTAEGWLRDVLDQARRGALPGADRTGVTFAATAAEWLRYIEADRVDNQRLRAIVRTPPRPLVVRMTRATDAVASSLPGGPYHSLLAKRAPSPRSSI